MCIQVAKAQQEGQVWGIAEKSMPAELSAISQVAGLSPVARPSDFGRLRSHRLF